MSSTVKHLSAVVAEVVVEISKEEVDKALNRAYSELGRGAQVRGFRRGKAPRAVLKRMFGDAVRGEVRGDLVGEHLRAALVEHDIMPVSPPEIDAGDLEEGAPLRFTANVERRPRLEDVSFDGVELSRHRVVVESKDVEGELERLRAATADVIDLPEPRPAGVGDLAVVAMKRWTDGEWRELPWPKQNVVIGEGRAQKEIEDALVGMSVGEEKVVDLGSATDLDESRVRYLVRLQELKARRLPELDDEFAKDWGDFETLAALREDIEKRIRAARERAEEVRLRHELFEALRAKNPVELPPGLVKRQADALRMRLASSLGMAGEPEGDAMEAFKKLADGAEKTSREIVHQHLLMLEIARLKKLEIGDEEIDRAIDELAAENGVPAPMLRAEYGKEGRREELATQLVEKKIFAFALPLIKIGEIDPPAEPADALGGGAK